MDDFYPQDASTTAASNDDASTQSSAQPPVLSQTSTATAPETQTAAPPNPMDTSSEFMPADTSAPPDATTTGTSPPPADGVAGTTPPPATTPPPLTPPASGPGTPAYSRWLREAQANGYSQDDINGALTNVSWDSNGNPIGGGYVGGGGPGNTGVDEPGNIGEDLGTWKPGDVYTGTGNTSGDFMSDETFTATMPENAPTPTEWTVTDEQTVQGQMATLTQNLSTNPVYQSLAASLERAQATHGGANSLMAETAAYNGVVNLAFQIASADAATYARSAEFNASTANQFSLSNLEFMHQASLSTQNYQQAQLLQAEQIQGSLQSVSMQIAGQIKATQISASAQVSAASIGARAQIQSAEIQRKTQLESIQANFESTWALNEQGQAHTLEQGDRNTDNAIRGSQVTFGQQLTLQMNSEQNANLRQLMGGVATIGATPGLTGAQQANAIQQITQMYKTNSSLTNSFGSSANYSMSAGQVGANINGTPSTAVQAGMATAPGGQTYQTYGDYLSYGKGAYTMTAPPVMPFYGGTGVADEQGGSPIYGSNINYENQTGARNNSTGTRIEAPNASTGVGSRPSLRTPGGP